MKHRFELQMRGLIEATDFDQAMAKLADHFSKLSSGVLPPDLFAFGTGHFELKEWVPPETEWDEAWDRLDKEKEGGE